VAASDPASSATEVAAGVAAGVCAAVPPLAHAAVNSANAIITIHKPYRFVMLNSPSFLCA
jgi:hypothetical protein